MSEETGRRKASLEGQSTQSVTLPLTPKNLNLIPEESWRGSERFKQRLKNPVLWVKEARAQRREHRLDFSRGPIPGAEAPDERSTHEGPMATAQRHEQQHSVASCTRGLFRMKTPCRTPKFLVPPGR